MEINLIRLAAFTRTRTPPFSSNSTTLPPITYHKEQVASRRWTVQYQIRLRRTIYYRSHRAKCTGSVFTCYICSPLRNGSLLERFKFYFNCGGIARSSIYPESLTARLHLDNEARKKTESYYVGTRSHSTDNSAFMINSGSSYPTESAQ